MSARIVELTDLPPCDSNVSDAEVFARGAKVAVMYDATSASGSVGWAVVRLEGCRTFIGNGPNDEAFQNHLLYGLGLKFYTLQEVVNSPWIALQGRVLDRDGDSKRYVERFRHFVFALKETTFECMAEGYALVGVFEERDVARLAAIRAVRD